MTQTETINAIQTVLEEIALPDVPTTDLEFQMVMDSKRHHYQVVVSGWRGMEYTHGIVVQIDLRGEYVWIAADNTDYDVAARLLELGVPKEKIVMGYHPPTTRAYTGFAVGES